MMTSHLHLMLQGKLIAIAWDERLLLWFFTKHDISKVLKDVKDN